jgi:5-methyltetrahydropteroyltriglutamate--homocysteine methyltransferase
VAGPVAYDSADRPHNFTELESGDFVKRRIEEAAKYADLDQLCLSAQCGFSSTREGNDLTPAQQWDKLRLIVEVAAGVWGE